MEEGGKSGSLRGGRRSVSEVAKSTLGRVAGGGSRHLQGQPSKSFSLGEVDATESAQPLLTGAKWDDFNSNHHQNIVGRLSVVGERRGGESVGMGSPLTTVNSKSGAMKEGLESPSPGSEINHNGPKKRTRHPTSYFETLVHVLKGNIGSGMFAMGEAFKNAGLLVGPVLTLLLGIICIYNNHVLLTAARFVQDKNNLEFGPGFSETVELCFELGPKIFRTYQNTMRRIVKVFVIITQLGFCCVYVVLVSSTLHTVLKLIDIYIEPRLLMLVIYFPILISCLITSLKFLAPISLGSNVCVIGALFLTLYVACKDGLPSIGSRPLVAGFGTLPLFLGTVIYAFEGIGLVLPLQNEMKKPENFGRVLGVLNVGLSIVTLLLITTGFIGYAKYGDHVKGSLSLNIDPDDNIGTIVQIVFAIGIGFSYPLQFYVAADIVWEDFNDSFGPYKRRHLGVMITRTLLVTATFLISAMIPNVGLFISLIGAVCATALALVFPALIDFCLRYSPDDPLKTSDHWFRILMDLLTLVIAVIGFSSGTYVSVKEIIANCLEPSSHSNTTAT